MATKLLLGVTCFLVNDDIPICSPISYIQLSNPFTVGRLIAKSALKLNDTSVRFWIPLLRWKLLHNWVLVVNTICILQQLGRYFNGLFNLFVVFKDIESRNGRTRTKGFFSTVRVVSLTTCMLSINLLKH